LSAYQKQNLIHNLMGRRVLLVLLIVLMVLAVASCKPSTRTVVDDASKGAKEVAEEAAKRNKQWISDEDKEKIQKGIEIGKDVEEKNRTLSERKYFCAKRIRSNPAEYELKSDVSFWLSYYYELRGYTCR
jgi:hypothetical protein